MTKPDIIAVFTYLSTISCEINRFRNDDDYLDLRLNTREGSKKIYLCFSSPFADIGSFKTLLRCWNNREKITGVDVQFDSGKEKYIISVFTGNKQVFAVFQPDTTSKMTIILMQITTWMADDAEPVDFQLQYDTWARKKTLLLFSINEGRPSFFYRFPEGTTCIVD